MYVRRLPKAGALLESERFGQGIGDHVVCAAVLHRAETVLNCASDSVQTNSVVFVSLEGAAVLSGREAALVVVEQIRWLADELAHLELAEKIADVF